SSNWSQQRSFCCSQEVCSTLCRVCAESDPLLSLRITRASKDAIRYGNQVSGSRISFSQRCLTALRPRRFSESGSGRLPRCAWRHCAISHTNYNTVCVTVRAQSAHSGVSSYLKLQSLIRTSKVKL